MPYNVTRSAQFLEKEILKFPPGLDAIKSVVLDSNFFPMPSDRNARNIVPAGTVLKLSVTNSKQMVAYDGTGRIEGILGHSVEVLVSATGGVEAAPMFYHQCVFATMAIVGFTNYASSIVSSLTTCKFE